ncbi:MAG: FimV/HubP family polar landmark protein [Chthoniobacteraceae bacterium]
MVRKLAAALLGVGVLIPGLANALGLGEIKLNSALSEPLDAEIELVQVRELTGTEILPSLANSGDFESAGVERSQFLTDLKFEVTVNEKGKSFIRVRSTKPVKEPFLNFLVEVNWPAGRLLREYTLFLDPPIYNAQRSKAPVSAPKASAPAPAPRQAAAPASRPAPAPAAEPAPFTESEEPAAEPASAGGAGSHRIGANDSLWSIAQELKPSNDVSIHQTMIALQRINPDAFINDNINLLKKGQVLRAPSTEEAQQVSSREAMEMVAEQNRAWRERVATRKGGAAQPEARQIDLTGRSLDQEPTQAPPSDEGRLKLLSGTGGEGENGQGGTEAGGGGELRNKLAVAEENADKFKLENEDLKVKMNDLSDQLKTSEKVLTLKDQQIAALQTKLAEMEAKQKEAAAAAKNQPAPAAESKPAVPAEQPKQPEAKQPEPEAVAPVNAEIEETPPAAETTQPDVDFNYQEETKPEAKQPEPQQPEAAAPQTAAEPSVGEPSAEEPAAEPESLPEQPATGAELAQPGSEPIVVEEKPVVVEQPQTAEPAHPAAGSKPAEQDLITQLISNPLYLGIGAGAIVLLLVAGAMAMRRKKANGDALDDALVEDFQMPEAGAGEGPDDMDMDFDEPVDAVADIADAAREETVPQTSDVIGEADIYIAYGRYPQAIEMLQKAAAKEPDRADIRLKLCEVSAEAKENDTFLTHYRALQGIGDTQALRRADDLRNRLGLAVPAAAAAATAAFAAPDDATLIAPPAEEESLDFDIAESAPAAAALEPESDGGLDFDLSDLEDTGARFAEPAPIKEEDAGLDFDLSLDLADTEESAPAIARDNDGMDFDFDLAESEPAAKIGGDAGLDFDSEFSLDSVEEPVKQSSGLDFDSDLSLDFDRVETSDAASPVADDNSLDFDLDFDTGSTQAPSAPQPVDDDRTIAFTPSTSLDFSTGADEPSLNAQSAAQLADELDLGGDFLSHEEPSFDSDATVRAPSLGGTDFNFEPTPVVPPVAPVAAAPSFAANDQIDSGDELDFLADADETSTKLDLARAYIDMGDRDGAKDILDEVMIEGSDSQKQEARDLLNRLEA